MLRLTDRPFLLAATLLLSLGLAGCETSDVMDSVSEKIHDFNPFGTAKTKLPGERRPVFPEGVPGVQQGIPPDLMPGNSETTATAEPEPQAEKMAEKEKPKAAPRRAAARTAPAPKRAARKTEPKPAAEPVAPAQQAEAPGARSAWDTVPTRGAASANAAQPQPAQGGQAGWVPPAAQPVPTIWPDPPKPAAQ
ncbi:MAG TPA: hypothetical protein VFQ27_04770 [Xanthobacteraceae bacterium]|nr:hypothetical protein [Xanthobacteraceae bacterium]